MKVASFERVVGVMSEKHFPWVPVAAYASMKVTGVQTDGFHEGEGLVVVIGTPLVTLFTKVYKFFFGYFDPDKICLENETE